MLMLTGDDLMRCVHLAPGSGQLLPWRTAAQSQSPPLVADSPAASSPLLSAAGPRTPELLHLPIHNRH